MITTEKRLLHRFRDGEAAIASTQNDYAFFIWGLINLYEATFNIDYLERAVELTEQMNKYFWDETNGGYFITADDAENQLVRPKEVHDGAIPSGNSVAMLDLLRLSRLTGTTDYEDKAFITSKLFTQRVASYPSGFTQFLIAMEFAFGKSHEVVVVGNPESEDTQRILESLRDIYLPNMVLILKSSAGNNDKLEKLAEYTKYLKEKDNKATVYVCQNFVCNQPTNDIKTMFSLLGVSGQK